VCAVLAVPSYCVVRAERMEMTGGGGTPVTGSLQSFRDSLIAPNAGEAHAP